MDILEARRCVEACVQHLRRRGESPRAAADLAQAVEVIAADAVRVALQARVITQVIDRTQENAAGQKFMAPPPPSQKVIE